MRTPLRLVWDNPHPQPHLKSDITMLRLLADILAGSIRAGHAEEARSMASIHHLSPLALGVVATRMLNSGISEDDILRLV